MIEYAIRWSASSNASFDNARYLEWIPWEEDPDATEAQVIDALCRDEDGRPGSLPRGLDEALECSGFEWSVQTRVADDTGAPNG